MKSIFKAILFIAFAIFSVQKIHAQTPAPANNQQKTDTSPVRNRTPRTHNDQPPVNQNDKNDRSPAYEQKTTPPAVTDRTPRTYNDQPAIKEVPKNYPPANVHQLKQQRKRNLRLGTRTKTVWERQINRLFSLKHNLVKTGFLIERRPIQSKSNALLMFGLKLFDRIIVPIKNICRS